MGDFWSGTTAYDQNQNKRDARDAANAETDRLAREKTLSDTFFNSAATTPYQVGGSPLEQGGRIEGLQRAKVLTGQNPYQIGQDYQEAYGNIKKRSQLSDTGSELLRASKAGAVATAQNQMQAQGVKGGAALGAVSAVERAKSYDVNNQLMDAQQKAQADYMNATKANANFTQASEMNYGSMAEGGDVKMPPTQSSGFGNFGTVICTELYNQGLMKDSIYQADMTYGMKMKMERPDIYWGYRLVADPIVRGMKKSKLFTKLVASFAIPWAHNMAGERNLVGTLVSFFGEIFCSILGHILYLGGFDVYNQKEV